ncbi:hypothetical protein JX265_005063 [Neoarthrinium moseri]|uniref:Cytochrome P450 n=1 Tax=Neoarthrinium moseri TaxID=1658444 RepID=A0A9P9WPD3_9PEZI|nr:hypothetical protein JX265_005063 [Neoarthrinium moseri]
MESTIPSKMKSSGLVAIVTLLGAFLAARIPYVVVPVSGYQLWWLLTYKLWMPLLRQLPSSWTSSWIEFLVPGWSWRRYHEPYKQLGSDVFLTVSPFGNILWVCDAYVISQITERRNDFPKDTAMYEAIDIFGKNLVTTEGNDWVRHRKATAATFSETNIRIVWAETLHQAQQVARSWIGTGHAPETVVNAWEDMKTLSLHVISRAGFGRKMVWPGETPSLSGSSVDAGINGDAIPEAHTLSFKAALSTVLENLFMVAVLPSVVLANIPSKTANLAYQAYKEWSAYMADMYQEKLAGIEAEHTSEDNNTGEVESMDLLGALIRNSASGGKDDQKALSKREVLGNAFIFMFGGHETTASTMYFAQIFLALHPASQRELQADLDAQFPADYPVASWDYDRECARLLATMPGAVLNETLRLVPPLMSLPKTTALGRGPQPLDLNGRTVYVPPGTRVNVVIPAAHRNPNYWPGPEEELHAFRPQRWLLDGASADHKQAGDLPIPFRPCKGAYLPFSEGRRACIGRRFALVEAVATLAVLLRHHSVELAVDDLATDEEVEKMGHAQRAEVWELTAAKARYMMSEGLSTLSFKPRDSVPLRFVERGSERFYQQ